MRWHLWLTAALIATAGVLIWQSGRIISSSPTPAATHAPVLPLDLDPLYQELRLVRQQLATLQPTATRTPRPRRTATAKPTDYPPCGEAQSGTCRQGTSTSTPTRQPTLPPVPTYPVCGTPLASGRYPPVCEMR